MFNDIYYDFDKATLRPESKAALQEMAKILTENPEVRVRLSSHADRHGPDAYNIGLSERRAQSVVAYLVQLGIDAARLEAKGYGKTKPRAVTPAVRKQLSLPDDALELSDTIVEALSDEEQAVADQLNRRTEFTVIEP